MRRALVLALVAGAACASVDTGSDTEPKPDGSGLIVTGGLPIDASQFAAVSGGATCTLGGGSTGIAYAAIVASDLAGSCADLQQGRTRANARSVDLVLVQVGSSAIATGEYPVLSTPGTQAAFALLQVSQNDGNCTPGAVAASGGTVIVTSVSGGELRGTIDALLPDGGTIVGAFIAPACTAALSAGVCAGTIAPEAPTCAP